MTRMKLGRKMVANIVMLGFFAAVSKLKVPFLGRRPLRFYGRGQASEPRDY